MLVHHAVAEIPPQLELLCSKVAEVLGVEVVATDLGKAWDVVDRGDAVFGLFVYEASHAGQAKRLAFKKGASWLGVVPPWLIAGAVLREAALHGARRVLLVSHRSKSRTGRQLAKIEEIIDMVRSHGIEADHVFLGDHVGWVEADLVFPLTVFRGWTWENACRLAGRPGSKRCAPPLIEGFWRVFVGWIVSSLRPCCQ